MLCIVVYGIIGGFARRAAKKIEFVLRRTYAAAGHRCLRPEGAAAFAARKRGGYQSRAKPGFVSKGDSVPLGHYKQNLCLPMIVVSGRLQIQAFVAVAGLK